MATYLVLNIVFMAVVLIALGALGALRWNRTMTWVMVILLVLTAVFDSLIIMAGIVDYDYELLLGLKIGAAPVEDFFYAVLAGVLVPNVWHWLERDEA